MPGIGRRPRLVSLRPQWADPRQQGTLMLDEKQLLELVANGTPLRHTLEALCREIEKRWNGMLCSVLLLDPDGLHLRHGAAPSLPEAYADAIDGEAIGPKAGSCGTAVSLKTQ